MSLINGDRARANKVRSKRRVRRTALRLLRRVSTPAKDGHTAAVPVAGKAA
jgi:hypothetical protein